MARARNLKPGFFKNEELVELPFSTRLLFAGLWTLADREGRLEDRPKRIKMDLFPADNLDIDEALNELQTSGFILRYEVNGARYIQIICFKKHQNPHKDEKASTIPPPQEHCASTVQAPCEPDANRADSLFSDSLSSDSPIPDSPNPEEEPLPPSGPPPKKRPEPETSETWRAYSTAYFNRYGTDPVRNASVNGKMAQFVARLGREEAPHVARFFVGHNNAYYVRQMHDVGAMLKDAEKLRTEWATNTRMTQAKASQADRTQTNADAFAPLLAAARAREEAERIANVQ